MIRLVCDVPPQGWFCTRGAGHAGPCAAHQIGAPDDSTTAEAVVWAAAYAAWLPLVPRAFPISVEATHDAAAVRAEAAVRAWREGRT